MTPQFVTVQIAEVLVMSQIVTSVIKQPALFVCTCGLPTPAAPLQLNCAHIENKLHEAREDARTNRCAAERRAAEYESLRAAAVHTRSLLERLARCLVDPPLAPTPGRPREGPASPKDCLYALRSLANSLAPAARCVAAAARHHREQCNSAVGSVAGGAATVVTARAPRNVFCTGFL